MRRPLILVSAGSAAMVVAAVLATSGIAAAQTLRPLVTEDVSTLPDANLELQLALELVTDYPSTVDARQGRLLRAPIVGLNYGLGDRAEIQLRAPLRQYFDPAGAPSASASGDVTLATKLRLVGGRGIWPGLGARVLVKLPNVSQETGIDTDETDVTLELLAGVDLAGARVASSLGVAILGDPTIGASQNDKLSFGLGFLLPAGRFEIGADLHGLRWGDSGRPDEWTALGALATHVGRVRIDGGIGLFARDDERSLMVTLGAGMGFRL